MGGYKRRGADRAENYTDENRRLIAISGGRIAGVFRRFRSGFYSFEYDAEYAGPPLSLTMPQGAAAWFGENEAHPFLEGLLPDSGKVRAAMAAAAGCKPGDIMGILARYGLDLAGSLQLCREDEAGDVIAGAGSYTELTEDDIARRLLAAGDPLQPGWHASGERWSLGGAQGKIALARIDGGWYGCEGGAPSTHILKPGVANMTDQALVEYLTMRLATAIRLDAASVEFAEFDGVPAIIAERYDRVALDGRVGRLHQEDLCQALGYLPERKYDPSPAEIISVLERDEKYGSKERFVEDLFYNYLIGGTDAHAKNFSLLHLRDGWTLAPMYDTASILPYEKQREAPRRVSLPIGGGKIIGQLRTGDVERFCRANNLDAAAAKSMLEMMAEDVKAGFTALWRDGSSIPNAPAVIEAMERTIGANCDAMIANLNSAVYVPPQMHLIESGTLKRGPKR